MGAIAALAAAVWAAIAATAASIALAVWVAVVWIAEAIAAAAAVIAAAISEVIAVIAAGIAEVYGAVSFWVSTQLVNIQFAIGITYAEIASWAEAVFTGISGFLEAIHFKALLQIHEIAYIVSEDYRQMFQKITDAISEFSSSLGLGSSFLNLVFRDARGLVLSASSLLGRPYDIGEIAWLSTFDGFLRDFQEKAESYMNNPSLVFYDVDRWLTKGAVDLQSEAIKAVYIGLEEAVHGFKEISVMTVTIRDQVNDLVAKLPENIRKEIVPRVDAVFRYVDKFQYDVFRPAIERAEMLVGVVGEIQDKLRGDMKSVVNRLKKPGDFLGEIDKLSPEERRKQEARIAEIATRGYATEINEITKIAAPEYKEFQKLKEALEKEYPPPPYEIPEVEVPSRPAGVPVEPRKTWFVGDY